MANTYWQIYVQLVFAVKKRSTFIADEWRERLHRYLTGIVQSKGSKLIAINSVPNHIHIFLGMNPDFALSDQVRDMKRSSTRFVNETILSSRRFGWQEGYGAFSYGRSQIDAVVKYILRQKEHHRQKSFREEYLSMLEKHSIDFDARYLFDWLENDEGGT